MAVIIEEVSYSLLQQQSLPAKPTLEFTVLPTISSLVRIVSKQEAREEMIGRSIATGKRFLNIGRMNAQSSAIAVRDAVLEDHTHIPLYEVTSRSGLVALSQTEVSTDEEVARFTEISIQVGPEDYVKANTVWGKHISTLFVRNIGPYGETKRTSVLQVLKDNLRRTDEKEAQKILFKLIGDRVKEGNPLSIEDLYAINPNLRQLSEIEIKLLHARLLAIVYLITNLEIVRRPHYEDSVGYKQGAAAVDPTILCCEVMLDNWTKVFKLLQVGALTIAQVFDTDAPYGLPAGKLLRKQDDEALWEKCFRINDLYMVTFYPDAARLAKASGKVAIPSMEEIHQRLVWATTKPKVLETPGRPYITPKKLIKAKRSRKKVGGIPFPVFDDEDEARIPQDVMQGTGILDVMPMAAEEQDVLTTPMLAKRRRLEEEPTIPSSLSSSIDRIPSPWPSMVPASSPKMLFSGLSTQQEGLSVMLESQQPASFSERCTTTVKIRNKFTPCRKSPESLRPSIKAF